MDLTNFIPFRFQSEFVGFTFDPEKRQEEKTCANPISRKRGRKRKKRARFGESEDEKEKNEPDLAKTSMKNEKAGPFWRKRGRKMKKRARIRENELAHKIYHAAFEKGV